MTELAQYQPQTALTDVMEYARAVSSAAMLPDAYRGKPADIMLAVGLGQAMGLSPAESLYRISVIKGKPTASAELIAANVRKAGHRLRMRVSEDPPAATCTIVRADDPDEPFVITRDMDWARGMGLADQSNYKKQPSTMLSWRAISACARLACPEALYGVAHTPDEIDADDRPARSTGGGLGAALAEQPTTTTAEQIHDDQPAEPLRLDTSSALAKAMYAGINEAGIAEADRIAFICDVIGREIETTKAMTEDEARAVLDHLPTAGASA
jgi:hypothetical protein